MSWNALPDDTEAIVNSKNIVEYRVPAAQFVKHRAAMQEAVSSIPAGPTLRVLK